MVAAVVGRLAAGIGRDIACFFFAGLAADPLADAEFSSLVVSLSILLAVGECTDAGWSSLLASVSISVVLEVGSDSGGSSLMVI